MGGELRMGSVVDHFLRGVYVHRRIYWFILYADCRLLWLVVISEVEVTDYEILALLVCVIWEFLLNICSIQMVSPVCHYGFDRMADNFVRGLHLHPYY